MRPRYVQAASAVFLIAMHLLIARGVAASVLKPALDAQNKEDGAIAEFDKAIAEYLAIQQKLRNEVGDLIPGSTAEQITSTSDTLAAAMQRARAGARQGDFFNADVSAVIKRRIVDAVRTQKLADALAQIDERPTVKTPSVHLRYPAASEMATMPPSLLTVLPPLPPELEYRIIGEYLVLRDVKAGLILDVLPRAIPRQ